MNYLWISPLALTHSLPDVGNGQCVYGPAQASVQAFSSGVPLTVTPWNNAGVVIELSTLAPSAYIEVTIQPTGALAGTHWSVRCDLLLEADGSCSLLQDPDCACTVSALGSPPQTMSLVTVFLSRVRDVTGRIAEELQNLPTAHPDAIAMRQLRNPLWQNRLPSQGPLHYVNTNRPDDPALSFTQEDITPDGENIFVEVRGQGPTGGIVPKLLSVFWPDYVPRMIATTQPGGTMWPVAEPTPFLIYYHSSTGQNTGTYYNEEYPESFDYLYYIHWSDHNYHGDPLAYALKGIPYQIARTRTHAVLVVPCQFAKDREIGEYTNNGNFIVESLEELQLLMLRRAGLFFCQPMVGRVGLGGFSAGTQLVANTLYGVANHPFIDQVLKEVYMFDPHMSQVSVLGGRAIDSAFFLSHGSPEERSDKMARIYTQLGSTEARNLLRVFLGASSAGPSGASTSPHIVDSSDSNRTAAVVPRQAWPVVDASGTISALGQQTDVVHQLIPAMMLSDALTRSGFTKAP